LLIINRDIIISSKENPVRTGYGYRRSNAKFNKLILFMNKSKGFTLIELLVVIAIIGILSSVVLASLNSAREKSRDAKRVSDIKQLQLALELYFDSNSAYPTALAALTTSSPKYIPVVPVDPLGVAYKYAALQGTASTACLSYHLGSTLENANHKVLNSDADAAAGTICTGSAADFTSTSADSIYDVKP